MAQGQYSRDLGLQLWTRHSCLSTAAWSAAESPISSLEHSPLPLTLPPTSEHTMCLSWGASLVQSVCLAQWQPTRGFDQARMMDGIMCVCVGLRKYLDSVLAYLKWLQDPVWLNLTSTPSFSSSRVVILIALPWKSTYTFWRMFFRKQV